ncbi:hypothetical protein LX69_00103 [Breznakibacter xylanolyticus]|uniref:Type IX secretion system protein PorV domain-containing protein n=1 Tax=Breznakibacter xylanolyticus TaxID=990 RepID=A0A2W7NLB9_9BACT|nr:type IX secretion system outer membrane channel protein PorV [Breznakibacter xylanolyticus]MBN2742352.1 type IX secretion system outer membrane channel protein PorV [Marinilabiliaceae bacterium]PZX20680.1 hypothetical protein LX69_00103 [Breznakibacter xylanolyticus]
MISTTLKKLTLATALAAFSLPAMSQVDQNELAGQMNVISTAVPFLTISPDSRAGGMGDVGVATSPDYASQAWNPAKYAFLDDNIGVSVSYTPWLRKLVDDINLYYVSGFYRIDKMQSVAASLRYFSVGSITYKQSASDTGYEIKPNEFAIDASYTRLLSDKFSGAVAFRYIRSDLSGGMVESMEAGNSFAADVAFFYKTPIGGKKSGQTLSAGLNISNIGAKISYDGGTNKEFIPTNMKLGAAYSYELDSYNAVTFAVDFNKLLVPTPSLNVNGQQSYAEENKDVSVISAMFSSFGDAPGGMEEEMNEVNVSLGAEYLYNKQFAIRAGYFHEHENKGNRKFMTIGTGLKFNIFNIDASYIIPVNQNNPLANTIRFSLAFDI